MNDLVVWQAAMDAKEVPTPTPALKSMKPNESIWKPGDYLLEVELMKYSLENRHIFRDNEPANARISTDGTPRITKSEFWRDCARRLNQVIHDRADLFSEYGPLAQGDASQKYRNLKKVYLQKLHKAHETQNFDEVRQMRHYNAFKLIYRPEKDKSSFVGSVYSFPFSIDHSPMENEPDNNEEIETINTSCSANDNSGVDSISSGQALKLLQRLAEAMEGARSEGRIHQMNMESQMNRLNMIENERNKLLKEANQIQAEQLKFQKEAFFANKQNGPEPDEPNLMDAMAL